MRGAKPSCLSSDPRKTSNDISWELVVRPVLELHPGATGSDNSQSSVGSVMRKVTGV